MTHDQWGRALPGSRAALGQARALPPSEYDQRQALFDEASAHIGLAQVAATMETHLRASVQREDAWLEALGDGKPTTIQAAAEIDDLEAGG